MCIHFLILLLASPEQIKKLQEDADRTMQELLEEERQAGTSAAAVSKKEKQTKESRQKVGDGQNSGKEKEKTVSKKKNKAKEIRQSAAEGQDGLKETIPKASPEQTKKKQEDDDSVMKELLGEEKAAGVSVNARSCPPSLQSDVEQSHSIMSATTADALFTTEALFMSKMETQTAGKRTQLFEVTLLARVRMCLKAWTQSARYVCIHQDHICL